MADPVRFSGKHLELADVAAHQHDLVCSLRLYFSTDAPTYAVRFVGYSPREVSEELDGRLDESDLTSSLTILAAVEAAFRIDYLQRCYKKKKDPLSRALRHVYKKRQQHASLEDEIFEAWIENTSGAHAIIGELRGAFKFRHWLAHGRYWKPQLGRRYDFDDVFVLANQALSSLLCDGS